MGWSVLEMKKELNMNNDEKKFTVIYQDSISSHIKMERIELADGENLYDAVDKIGATALCQFIFHGWPRMKGESQ